MVSQTRSRATKIIIIITSLSYPLLSYRTWGTSSLPAQFGIISAHGRQRIFETGKLPDSVQGPTWVGALRDNGAHDPLNTIFSAQINIITGTTGVEESLWFMELFPWHYLILLPIFVFAFTRGLSKVEAPTFKTVDVAILAGFILFPVATRPLIAFRGFNARSSVAIVLFHLVLALFLLNATAARNSHRRWIIVYGIVLAGLFPSHHTWAYYLLAIVGAMGIVGFIHGSRLMRQYSLYGLFIWACSSIYIAINQIREWGRLLTGFVTQIDNLSSLLRPTASAEVSPEYLASLPTLWTPLQIVNRITIVLIFVLSGVLLARRFINNSMNPLDRGFEAIFLAQSAVAAGLFIWAGLGGLRARIFEVSIPVSRLLVGYLLFTLSPSRFKNVVRGLAFIAIITCLLSMAIYPASHSNQISTTEAAGIETVGEHTPTSQAIFSDYRLAPAFMLYGPTEIYTVDSRRMSANETEKLLDTVYYHGDDPANNLDGMIGNSQYTVYITNRQTTVGILEVSLTRFRPAEEQIDSKWSQSDRFNRIYSNGEGVAYHRHTNN
ncbi:hypothetical protein HT576_10750 [Haloterrigena sp. SYSU A121-1]|uniref:Uncharacterized protein n=1 Tax=Haloterrigena gelatinilytica TaxID=2741724 RepID=A0A8J8GK57_9EURY|nr:hypothetical protein [Haloterrigena gelatinilytica]NUB91493.1 hypothetical protein [Haloterrigena gelatinilytica]